MKILHIINNLGSGGAEKLIEEMLPIMNKYKGVKADVLLLTDENNVFDRKLEDNGVEVNVIPIKKLYSPFNVYYIRKYIVKGKYDIVHSHLFPTIYWTAIASKLIFKSKPKFIMTEHNTHNRRREIKYLKYLEKFIYFSYNSIISISKSTQENLIFWLKPSESNMNKFIVIENGVNINRFKNAVEYKKSDICESFTNNTKLICMIGRFSKQKDQATVIKAMKNLPNNVHLLLVGEGALKEKNETLTKDIGVEKRVHFLGFRNDVERILKTVDVVVLSSYWEGFGLAAVEGMAAGKPLLASNVSGLREIVKDAGILFERGDSIELAKIINCLIKDKDKYKEISQKCSKKADLFSIRQMNQRYINLYKNY